MEPHCSADAVGNTRDCRRVPAGGLRGSTAGEYAGNIFWIVGFALIVSWIVAVVFTPYLGVKMLPAIKPIEGGTHAIYNTPNYRRLRRLITFAVRHKFVTVGIVGIAFALSGVGMGALKQQFFPTSDRPEGWWRFACRKAPASRRRLPQSKSSNTGWTTSPRPRSSRAMSVRALPAFLRDGAQLPDPAFAKIVVLTRRARRHRLREAVRGRP